MYSAELWLCRSRLSLWTAIYVTEFTFEFVRHAYQPWAEATNARVRIFMLSIEVHGQHMRPYILHIGKRPVGNTIYISDWCVDVTIWNAHAYRNDESKLNSTAAGGAA